MRHADSLHQDAVPEPLLQRPLNEELRGGGQFVADVSKADQGLIRMRLEDVEGYDHIGIVSIGWIQFGMTALGKKDVRIAQQGWSQRAPAPRAVEYEVKWS